MLDGEGRSYNNCSSLSLATTVHGSSLAVLSPEGPIGHHSTKYSRFCVLRSLVSVDNQLCFVFPAAFVARLVCLFAHDGNLLCVCV